MSLSPGTYVMLTKKVIVFETMEHLQSTYMEKNGRLGSRKHT